MTGSSSRLLQIQGKWYQERKANKNQNPRQKKQQKLFYTVIRNWITRIFTGFASVIRIYRVRKHMETSFPVLISLEQNPMNFRVPLQDYDTAREVLRGAVSKGTCRWEILQW